MYFFILLSGFKLGEEEVASKCYLINKEFQICRVGHLQNAKQSPPSLAVCNLRELI